MLYTIKIKDGKWAGKTGGPEKSPTIYSRAVNVVQRLNSFVRTAGFYDKDPEFERYEIWIFNNELELQEKLGVTQFIERHYTPDWDYSCHAVAEYYGLLGD